ncbi:MAG: NRDE family protein [Spirochaetia bacterium]|nr:NRDE family protein [Spirochaetia bacterium]
MCMLLIGRDVHPDYKLIVAANRDEEYRRPTAAAHWWPGSSSILAGSDLSAGGTWLGITKSGRFAALTNYWGGTEQRPEAPSRGGLVSGFLRSSVPAPEYFHQPTPDGLYNGFNLVMGNVDSLWYYSNADESQPREIERGIHVLSNDLLDVPWPKARTAHAGLQQLIDSGRVDPYSLLELLGSAVDEKRQQDPTIPRSAALELAKASIKIEFPRYGTRSSTVLLVDRVNRVRFIEKTFYPNRVNDFSFTLTHLDCPEA